jgi:hypothetical protein
LRFSRAQQKAILSWAKDLGATILSYKKLQAIQTGLLSELGNPTTHVESGQGNIYYLNEIGDSIAKVTLSLHRSNVRLIQMKGYGQPAFMTWNGFLSR